MKSFEFWLKFKFVHKGPINNSSIGSDNGLAPFRRQSIIWTSGDPVRWCIYAALGGDELMCKYITYWEWNLRFSMFCVVLSSALCVEK